MDKRRVYLALAFVVMSFIFIICLGQFALHLDGLGIQDQAFEAARRRAVAQGFDVQGGGGMMSRYIQEPDGIGGMEVEIPLWMPPENRREREYIARVRRRCLSTNWYVIEASPRFVDDRVK